MPKEVAMLRFVFQVSKSELVIPISLCLKMLRCLLRISYYTFSIGHWLVSVTVLMWVW